MSNYCILNEVLDIRYLDKDNVYQNKQLTINKKILSNNKNLDVLKKTLKVI